MILNKTIVFVKGCHLGMQRTNLQKPSGQSRNQVKTLKELLPKFYLILHYARGHQNFILSYIMHEVTFVIESDISLG